MAPNDTQMDVLMRRFAKRSAERTAGADHLDADELNAFAEGNLPTAARSRYVSHLSDCAECRKLASQLAISAGVVTKVPATEPVSEKSWWQGLAGLFSPPALRYAAFALVVFAVVGTAFVVWRRPGPSQRNADLIARNEPTSGVTAGKPLAGTASQTDQSNAAAPGAPERGAAETKTALAQPTPVPPSDQKGEGMTALSPPPPPKPETVTESEGRPTVAAKSAVEPAKSEPGFAPQPSVDPYRMEPRSREQQNAAGARPGGPRRSESYEKYKVADRAATANEQARNRDEDRGGRAANQQAVDEVKQEETATQARKDSGIFASVDTRTSMSKADVAENAQNEPPPPRSVGGRKFHRQGNAWVDAKFKSSMSVKNVARGSDEFASLDSGLRSIAQQLSGEVLVVWKGKAYRIR